MSRPEPGQDQDQDQVMKTNRKVYAKIGSIGRSDSPWHDFGLISDQGDSGSTVECLTCHLNVAGSNLGHDAAR